MDDVPSFSGLPADHPAVRGEGDYALLGASTLFDNDGNPKAQWVKTRVSQKAAELETFRQMMGELTQSARGKLRPVKAPKQQVDDLLTVIPIGDHHLGMINWEAQTGSNYDVNTGCELLLAAIKQVIGCTPRGSKALLAPLGDFFHADNSQNKTLRRGHKLDADIYQRVCVAGTALLRECIDLCLRHFSEVTVWPIKGNHDEHSMFWLGQLLAAAYEREDRLHVDLSQRSMLYLEHGRCLLAGTHGHGAKRAELGEVLAGYYPKAWGRTEHRHIYTGHIHHDTMQERRGVSIETVRILAPKDAYSEEQQHVAGRDIKADVWHKEHGRINRHIIGVSRL